MRKNIQFTNNKLIDYQIINILSFKQLFRLFIDSNLNALARGLEAEKRTNFGQKLAIRNGFKTKQCFGS